MQNRIHGRSSVRGAGLVLAAAIAAAVAAGGAAAGRGAPALAHGSVHAQLRHHQLIVVGTNASDRIALRLEAGRPDVLQVDAGDDGSADFGFDVAQVQGISVYARAGDDSVRIDDGNGAFTNTIPTTIAGGDGNDTLAGGIGAEQLFGGAGNDSIDGNGGSDVADLGAGDDTFVWDPGDGSDTIEGADGIDTMVFNGAGAGEQVNLSANGDRLTFARNPGNITMDTHGVERVAFNALGGADVVTVNDLSGTGVDLVTADLAGTLGGVAGDGQPDRVVVDATNGNDTIDVSGDAGGIKTSGLAATVEVLHPEAGDRLEVNTLAGRDTVDSIGLAPGSIQLLVNGVPVP